MTNFGTNTDDFSTALTIQPDGKLTAAGSTSPNPIGNSDIVSARYNNNVSNRNRPPAFDFDGDGKTDISVFRPDTGIWYLNRSQDGHTGYQFGIASDKLVPADYDGDGKTDVSFYRNGDWFILKSAGLTFAAFNFGLSSDVPMPADYDGDGQADIAVFRSSSGTWYLQQSANGFTAKQFGISSDKPIPNAFVP